MRNSRRLFAIVLAAAVCVPAVIAATYRPAFAALSADAAIDGDCLAIQNALPALHPTHLALVKNKWTVVNGANFVAAQKTTTAITLVDAYKQGKNYAWVVGHQYDANGNQRAVQLCYRQSDGSLQRAKQAATLPGLSASDVRIAYFTANGTLLAKVGVFEVNDPMVAKQVTKLPFFALLP